MEGLSPETSGVFERMPEKVLHPGLFSTWLSGMLHRRCGGLMNENEELQVISKIRDVIGCRHRPKPNELVQIVDDLVFIAESLLAEHKEMKAFTSGFNAPTACNCPACVKGRKIFGEGK
jgi:hypothetical protein